MAKISGFFAERLSKFRNLLRRKPREFSAFNFKSGKRYIVPSFQIQPESHSKSIAFLNAGVGEVNVDERFLLPSETWGTVRALTHSAFARINQTVVAGAEWRILAKVQLGEKLSAETVLDKKIQRGNISVSKWKTAVRDSQGRIVAENFDNFAHLNDTPKYRFAEKPALIAALPKKIVFDQQVTARKRFSWNPAKWVDNIHNDEPAQKRGYAKGLTEFVNYFDWIFNASLPLLGDSAYKGTAIRIKSIKPIYDGDKLRIIGAKTNGSGRISVFFLKGADVRLEAELINPAL